MPVNMKAIRKMARVKPKPAPTPEPPKAAPAPKASPKPAPAPVVEETPEPAPVVEWSMANTKAELIAGAEAAGVEFKSTWTKADILAALTA
jgi:outer membrane biosynthesis protein TonB